MTPFSQAHEQLAALGFHPIPLIAYDAPHGGKGKAPGTFRSGGWQGMTKWQRFRDETLSGFDLKLAVSAPGANIGIVCGTQVGKDRHVVVLDFDATDADALQALLAVAPASPMVKRGQKGESRFYLAPKTRKTCSYDDTSELDAEGQPVRKRLLDVLTGFDTRQTVVPPSIHPDTRQPYSWTRGPVPAAELPVLTDEDMEAIEEALEQCGWSREGRSAVRSDRPARTNTDIDPDSLWSEVKAAAMGNLSAWVPALNLYGCRPARGGYEAVATWRASCSGRPIAERKLNLSIQTSGIKDFGTNDTYSAIDLVMAARDCGQPEATDWLRERLGLKDDSVVVALVSGPVSSSMSASLPSAGWFSDHDLPEPLRPKPSAPESGIILPSPARTVDNTGFEVGAELESTRKDVASGDTDGELPDALTRPPGLLGALTDWIADSARKPQRGGALLAALEIVGTAAGRTFSGPTKTGTHTYGLFLAPSGAAKDHPLKCIDRVLRASTMGQHVGPGEFMSMSALISRLNRQPLTLTCIDEFGGYLGRINGRKASPHEKAITRTLRSAWGSSFDTMQTPEWAGRVGEPIFSPALSIYGVSTHEEFFENLDGGDVFNGFLNRFLIISTHRRIEEREPLVDKLEVPDSITADLVQIYTAAGPMLRATSSNGQSDGPLIVVPWASQDARSAYMAFGRSCESREQDSVFFTRSAEMAQRLATIRAIGINPASPSVTLQDMEWGIQLALFSAEQTVAMARSYMAETQHQGEAQRVLRVLRGRSWTAFRDISQAMKNRLKSRDLKDMLDGLVDGGDLEREERLPPSGGHKVRYYRTAT